MRLVAATLLATAALAIPASAEDCVTNYVQPLTYTSDEIPYVTVGGGSVAVHYDLLVDHALMHVGRTVVLVDCIV